MAPSLAQTFEPSEDFRCDSCVALRVRTFNNSAIVAVLVMSAISHRGMAASGTSDGLERHSQEVIKNPQDLLLELQSAESSDRA
jgi:hypothetical protein